MPERVPLPSSAPARNYPTASSNFASGSASAKFGLLDPNNQDALLPRDANAQRMPQPAAANPPPKARQHGLKPSTNKEHPPPPPPQVLEPPSTGSPDGLVYQVGKMLGKGGFALCYVGHQMDTKQRYALKVVRSKMPPKMEQKLADIALPKQFQTELQIHSKMKHKNIVNFLRAFAFENSTYLVLELCSNGSLMDMVRRRKGLTEPEVRFYSVQVSGAIKYMHTKGIIHRDLKMGNIFLDSRMNAKIGDFGLAALVVTGTDMHTIRRTTLCGTPNYIAPEILEKGKKGHDHMVDIWSLGIIMFAMLTSKPPFQSATTDEIYRRARERDYEWPTLENGGREISIEAQDVVATMLTDADLRPEPDTIVAHPFFRAGYMPLSSEITTRFRELPPEAPEFYIREMNIAQQQQAIDNFHALCAECSVGSWNMSSQQPPTKANRVVQVWKEMAAEEKAGLTPMIPLAEDVVYRPFEEWQREQRSVERAAQRAAERRGNTPLANGRNGLLRQPPQSFAAQQRAINKPAAGAAATTTVSSTAVGPPTTSFTTVQNTAAAMVAASEAEAQTAAETISSTTSSRSRHVRENSGASSTSAPSSSSRSREPREPREPRESRERTGTSSSSSSSSSSSRSRRRGLTSSRSATSTSSTSTSATSLVPSSTTPSLFSPLEQPIPVLDSEPDCVLARLERLQTELERALNARTMAILTSKTAVAPPAPQIVVKWVDYTNKFGLGYILNNGNVGCVLRAIATTTSLDANGETAMLPPACMMIPEAEQHMLRRNDLSYADRLQHVPMTEPIHLLENHGEMGLTRLAIDPRTFRVAVVDGVASKLEPGRDVYHHRKRERIILWRKFANYMITYGRDDVPPPSGQHQNADPDNTDDMLAEALSAKLSLDNPNSSAPAPADLVIFYQRFGDVGCWMFGDGHLQFNFPDHTKIVLDSTGTWCHFWHLPQRAAEKLRQTGQMDEEALDERSMLSYPLQTLLNFTKSSSRRAPGSTSSTSASSSTTRRRPEIPAELQGIPEANDLRRKIEFIKNIVREWVANGGLGNSSFDRHDRLRWLGAREINQQGTLLKHVWVTVGARNGDRRVMTFVDPRKPDEIGEDIDEERRKR
ncbi:Serine/threonine-protein kinase plo1 [Ceratocystis fimbriata CBS 114723]|uniref:Serine/threonine-protein kinase plo1 n=1 Tax=Ceratocystis fimbriata CBS 114723 TaxID=1035309 RepID=A0A2C5XKL7_9PEZI|nr:Serine/threonine-protein kinase plo1 [Ceratocystis fimbriata CBS 114723]